ncbi:MAG: metallophosphoesterase [Euryarchaeota archaeon]|nr:metallophosphoesterase [Euryarchaeota archaeon]
MIGIMSDTHDNLDAIRKAVDFFNKEGVDQVIHAGDLIAPFTVKEFEKLQTEFMAIFGNNDGERDGLRTAYKDICILEDFKEFDVGGNKIGVIHGTNEAIVNAMVKSGNYDIVIRGHTHKLKILEEESLIINPGEVCGYVSGQKTVVLLDTRDLSYEVVNL